MEARPWFKSYDPGVPHTLEPYPERTLLDVMADTLSERPDHTALIFKGTRMPHAELERLTNAFSAALQALGVQKGERVALVLPNCPQAVIGQIGAWKAGAIVAPINPLYTERELEYSLVEIRAESALVLTPFYAKIKAVQPRTPVKRVIATNIKEYLPPAMRLLFTLAMERKEGHRVALGSGDYWLPDLLRRNAGAPRPPTLPGPRDPAILLFSGGTTGTPKAALGTHVALLTSAMQLQAYARSVLANWDDVLTWVMPIFHVYGNMALNTALLARWPLAVVPNPRDIDDLVATIRKVHPACLHGVPTLFIALLNHPDVRSGRAGIRSMKICWSAAAPLMAETKQRFEDLTGGWLLEAYAMTETMLAAACCPIHGVYKQGSVGVPLPDVDMRIVDIDSGEEELATGQVGEIIVQAPQIMLGYWERPTETANMIREGPRGGPGGRWVYTGDLGTIDEDGYVFIVDRKKDLIKPGGFQVWPREVEEVIAAHPAVAEVSVAGMPDERQGEAVKAWIVLRPGQQATADEIRAYCRGRLAGYKVPRQVEFRDSLPKTMVGKVLRRELTRESASATGGLASADSPPAPRGG
jgi:long-chain acyl-CoA synthetase